MPSKISADKVKLDVQIKGGIGSIKNYYLLLPDIRPATLALLNEIKDELIVEVQVTGKEILDPTVIDKLKERFAKIASIILEKKLPLTKPETNSILVNKLVRDMLGLGDIEFLLNDTWIEEIVINSAIEPVRIYHKKYGWLETNIFIPTESQILNYSNIIARRVGRQITALNPLLDAHLVTGDRANAVLYPIASKGHTITIRKFARDPWTVTDFIENQTVNSEIMSIIWLGMQYEMNILVSGGTASGKTSLLNVMLPFIPPNQRIITIEDTRELELPVYLYWVPLVTRLPNPEGKGEITMLDLLINSLRMRPDRIILGEIRRKRDAEVLFESMHTGHSVYGTVHANTVGETIQRLINPPIEVAENLLQAVHLNVVMFRDRRRGIRRVFQVGEFLASEEEGNVRVRPNIIYRWKPGVDKIVQHGTSTKFFEEVNRHTGLSDSEIQSDLRDKQKILDWMVKNKVRQVNDVGKVMKDYYIEPEIVLKVINKNSDPKELLKND
ncbi:CpaF family protein [Candidatus Woesearchaeota archaeon]|nr:CpaF family protein [Candidatus Woesearchaeota archaeon]